jgi:hypothetical protein
LTESAAELELDPALHEGNAGQDLIDGRIDGVPVGVHNHLGLLRWLIGSVDARQAFVTFVALALYEHPEWRQKLQARGGDDRELFVHEVRRYYPFFRFVRAWSAERGTGHCSTRT